MSDGNDQSTFGDCPPELLRFFKKRKYAEEFISGIIRVGSLRYYQCIEDEKRKDPNEGSSSFTVLDENILTVKTNTNLDIGEISVAPGIMHINAITADPIYILSCTDPQRADIAKLKEEFGKHVVRISDPIELGQKLTYKFFELDPKHPFACKKVDCCKVSYGVNQLRDKEPSNHEIHKSSIAQKPAKFSKEGEVRLIVIPDLLKFKKNRDGDRVFDNYYSFDLDGPLNCAQMFDENKC